MFSLENETTCLDVLIMDSTKFQQHKWIQACSYGFWQQCAHEHRFLRLPLPQHPVLSSDMYVYVCCWLLVKSSAGFKELRDVYWREFNIGMREQGRREPETVSKMKTKDLQLTCGTSMHKQHICPKNCASVLLAPTPFVQNFLFCTLNYLASPRISLILVSISVIGLHFRI